MDQIKITLADVQTSASQIRNINEQIYDVLQSCKNEMDKLQSFWQSESSDTARSRFTQFAQQFDQQKTIIDSYAQFLDHTVQTYDSLETVINSNATSF